MPSPIIVTIVGIGLAATLSSGCDLQARVVGAGGSFDRTLTVDGPVTLSIGSGSGDVRVTAGPDNSVHIIGHLWVHDSLLGGPSAADTIASLEANPPVSQSGNVILVGDTADGGRLTNGLRVTYDITAPAGTRVTSRTGSGDQQIAGIAGPVDAAAGSGDLRVGPLTSNATVTAVTGSGNIEVVGATGPITMTAGSGDVRASHVAGVLSAKTGSGDIAVDGRPDADWYLASGSGDIAVRLPVDARFTLDASARSGEIDLSHPLETRAVRSRRQASGTAGGGGPRLVLSAGSGSIRVD